MSNNTKTSTSILVEDVDIADSLTLNSVGLFLFFFCSLRKNCFSRRKKSSLHLTKCD